MSQKYMYLYCRTNNNVQIRPFAFKVKIPLALLFHSSTIVAKNKIKQKKIKTCVSPKCTFVYMYFTKAREKKMSWGPEKYQQMNKKLPGTFYNSDHSITKKKIYGVIPIANAEP